MPIQICSGKRGPADSRARGEAGTKSVGSRRIITITGGAGIYIPGQLRGVTVKYLVDTGSTDTVISIELFNRLKSKQTLLGNVDVTQADGTPLKTLGLARMDVQIGTTTECVEVIVANIDVEAILGLDYLRATGATIDFNTCQIHVRGETLQCLVAGERSFCARITVQESVTVPPGHEAIVTATITGRHDDNMTGTALIDPVLDADKEIMIARSIVNIKTAEDILPVRVFNAGVDSCVMKKGTMIGRLTPLDDSDIVKTNMHMCKNSSPVEVPGHLIDLLSRSTEHLNEEHHRMVALLLEEYQDIFSTGDLDIGRTDLVEHGINTGHGTPIKQRSRRVAPSQQKEIDKQVEKMLEQGVIEPTDSPWASPVVLVSKKDGTQRFCVDYRKLNERTIKDAYPLPRINESLDSLGGAKWFSTLDMASGYWQVPLTEKAKKKSAFVVRGGLYQFNVLPFGLCNAPATFERLMEKVLTGLQWELLLLYLDDIIVFGNSIAEELERLKVVFERLRAANLKLKPKKCHLFQKQVTYLGHIVSEHGVGTDPDKVKAVRGWPTPNNITEVRSFIGLCSYYRKYVRGFAGIAKPLHNLTKKNAKFQWTAEADQAFKELKERLTTSPILAYPLDEGEFTLDTDASANAMGAVLTQCQNGEDKVIAYASKTFSKEQRNYCTTRRELCAVVTFIKHHQQFLYGRRFRVRTDHGSLVWLTNFKDPSGQLARWLEVLQQFDFRIVHRAGRSHGNADGMSRIPCKQCKRESPECGSSGVQQETLECGTSEVKIQTNDTEEVEVSQEPITNLKKFVPAHQVNLIAATPQLDAKTIRQEQLKDESMANILQMKDRKEERPLWDTMADQSAALKTYWSQWDMLAVQDGVLKKRWESGDGRTFKWLTVLPRGLRAFVLKQLHENNMAGHFGGQKTEGRVKERFYWCGAAADIRSFVRHCTACAKRKNPTRKRRAKVKQYRVGAPLERIAIDVLGPLPQTDGGNVNILVVGDYFTRWMEAYPIPDQKATTVAQKLVDEFICRFGVPMELHSDQGRNFESQVFSEMCQILGISKTRTTAYHPESDGLVERYNRTIVNAVSLMIQPLQMQRDWDTYLPYVGFAYRSSVQATTEETPNMLMLGREVRCPLDLITEGPPDEQDLNTDYAEDLREKLRGVHERARHAVKVNQRHQEKNYNRKATEPGYSVGDFVWLNSPRIRKGISKKLTLPWEGPYLIVKKLGDVVLRIQKTSRSLPKVVHANRLKPYLGPPLTAWKYDVQPELQEKHVEPPTEQVREKEQPIRKKPRSRKTRAHGDDQRLVGDAVEPQQAKQKDCIKENPGTKADRQTAKERGGDGIPEAAQTRRNPGRERRRPERYR
jgi:predicted aspartyl protease